MTNFRADLHCHTNCSDGSMSPKELLLHAKALGLSGIAITDHDSILAYETAIEVAQEIKICLGTGVEFSSTDGEESVHILGYDFYLENAAIQALCQKHVDRRRNRNQKILDKLASYNLFLDMGDLEGQTLHSIGRPHIALALMKKGYVASIQEAFNQWIGDGKRCFDRGEVITTDETIDVIHQAEGKAFLAHPHLMKRNQVLALLKKPFDGLESYYSICQIQEEKKWVKIAQEKNLLISGGSDFHGKIKPGIRLGCSWVNQEIFDTIFQKNRWIY